MPISSAKFKKEKDTRVSDFEFQGWQPRTIELQVQESNQIFDGVYEDKFIDKLVTSNSPLITRKAFISQIVPSTFGNLLNFGMGLGQGGTGSAEEGAVLKSEGDQMETMGDGTCDWLFSPCKIRQIYHSELIRRDKHKISEGLTKYVIEEIEK